MTDSITLNNEGTGAWRVTSVSSSTISTTQNSDNPTIEFTAVGTRYEMYNNGFNENHPLELIDANGDPLLSQSSSAPLNSDASVNWVDNGFSVEFTLTQALSDSLHGYQCAVHIANMRGGIITTSNGNSGGSVPPVSYGGGGGGGSGGESGGGGGGDGQPFDYAQPNASATILTPSDGAILDPPFTVDMQVTNFTVEASSNPVEEGKGHLHLLVDHPFEPPGEIIPRNPADGYYHYGDGSTSAELDLEPGYHTITMQAATSAHRAYSITDQIEVVVESGLSGTPVINAITNVNGGTINTLFDAISSNAVARENLSQSKRNIDAVSTSVNAIEGLDGTSEAIKLVLCRREGRDPANFADLDALASNPGLMEDIADRQASARILARSQKASAAAAASPIAMNQVGGSSVARGECFDSGTALAEIRQRGNAFVKLVAGEIGLDPTQFPDLSTLVSDLSAVQALYADQKSFQEFVDTTVAMQALAASATALQELSTTPSVTDDVADSGTAISAIQNASTAASNSVPGPNDAPIYIADLRGGGGGANLYGGNSGDGGNGGSTSFHESVGQGGAGRGRGGGSGSGYANSPDRVIFTSTGGGGSGGSGRGRYSDGGYSGGRVKSLIVNPDGDNLSLGVGGGGRAHRGYGGDGGSGSATVWTPNILI